MRIDKRKFYHLDWYLIILSLTLFAIGIMNLISATSSFYSGSYNFIIKQLVAFAIGIILIRIIIYYDYRVIASQAKWLYASGILFVILVLIIGMAAGGARRWISFFGISLQPSEFMKPILVICLANMLSREKKTEYTLESPRYRQAASFHYDTCYAHRETTGPRYRHCCPSHLLRDALVCGPQEIDIRSPFQCWRHFTIYCLALSDETVPENEGPQFHKYRR